MKNKPLNHKYLGGDAVDTTRDFKIPQRKTNSSMNGEELLRKAVTGTHKETISNAWGDMLKK